MSVKLEFTTVLRAPYALIPMVIFGACALVKMG